MYKAVRPLLFLLPPEAAHNLALHALRLGRPVLPLLKPWLVREDPRQAVECCGLRFPNRVGLGAGCDKAAEALDSWQFLGFGHIELGTVTALAQPGNPKPRAFRYPKNKALINRFGFNNPGAEAFARRLERYRAAGRWPKHPVGINLGKSKVTPLEEAEGDYLRSLALVAPYADYIAVNVSSPNTPGLRSLQEAESIRSLACALKTALKARPEGPKPLFVKLAPDLDLGALLAAADAALEGGADGLILTNTTLSREGISPEYRPESQGGLSGLPLREKADACLEAVARHTHGRVPLIGVGGIFTAEDAKAKIERGATLVQVYTGFIYEGPQMPSEMTKKLGEILFFDKTGPQKA